MKHSGGAARQSPKSGGFQTPFTQAGSIRVDVVTARAARAAGIGVMGSDFVLRITGAGAELLADRETLPLVLATLRPRSVNVLALPGESTTELWRLLLAAVPRAIPGWRRYFLRGDA